MTALSWVERGKTSIALSVVEDIQHISQNMRNCDIDEIWASNNLMPREALLKGLKESDVCLTVWHEGIPIAMLGVVSDFQEEATIWMLGTDTLEKIPNTVGILSRKIIAHFHERYPVLFNYVDVRNTKSIEWLEWLGAKFMDNPVEYGPMKMPFKYFVLIRPGDNNDV